jgi:hypothetical protein
MRPEARVDGSRYRSPNGATFNRIMLRDEIAQREEAAGKRLAAPCVISLIACAEIAFARLVREHVVQRQVRTHQAPDGERRIARDTRRPAG